MVRVGTIASSTMALLAGLILSSAQCDWESTQGPCFFDSSSPDCSSEVAACSADASCLSCLSGYNDANDACFPSPVYEATCDEIEEAVCCSVPSGCDLNDNFGDFLGCANAIFPCGWLHPSDICAGGGSDDFDALTEPAPTPTPVAPVTEPSTPAPVTELVAPVAEAITSAPAPVAEIIAPVAEPITPAPVAEPIAPVSPEPTGSAADEEDEEGREDPSAIGDEQEAEESNPSNTDSSSIPSAVVAGGSTATGMALWLSAAVAAAVAPNLL